MNVLPPDILAKLQADYVASFSEKLSTVQEALKSNDWEKLKQLFHKLAGSGATYMMPEITILGRALEGYLSKNKAPDAGLVYESVNLLERIFEARRQGQSHPIEGHPVVKRLT